MTAREIDERVVQFGLEQHGVFTLRQTVELGVSSSMARRRVAAGAWRRLMPGLFALAGSPPTWMQRLKAAELSVPSAAVSGISALALHRLPGGLRGRPHITVPTTANSRSPLAIVRRSTRITTTRVEGIQVTTPEQTVVDVAGSLPYGTVERALDHGILEGTVGLARFRRRCEVALGGRTPGSETLRALLFDHGDGFVVAQSELERRLYRLLCAPAVPKVVSQAAFPWQPCSRERVDALIPSWRLIVEADGRRWHCRVQDFERDRRRDHVAVANGYRVLRFTWGQLTESPKDVLSLIRAAGQWTVAA